MENKALSRYGRNSRSVFDLVGHGEVDLTAALGWTLTRSPRLLSALWERMGMSGIPAAVEVALEVADAEGRTDLQLVGHQAMVIVEAKKGWLVPGEAQLSRYAGRFEAGGQGLLVTLSDSSTAWAAYELPDQVAGTPVLHLPWDEVRADVGQAIKATQGSERVWLRELSSYLAGATSVRDKSDQWVYCVVVSDGKPGGGDRTFRDFVTTERVYFHPYGGHNGWPKRPPNLIGFRWGGRVRQISRVASYEVVPNLHSRWPDIPTTGDPDRPHLLYELGPDLPIPVIPTKGTYATARVWALLDQLLTQPTLQDAVRVSKELTT